jgi:hypothetical protein
VNLQSYCRAADLGLLSAAEKAGLAPYLIGRELSDEVIVIAARDDRAFLVRAIPIHQLGNEFDCGVAAAYWSRTGANRFRLIGHANDSAAADAAITGLADVLSRVYGARLYLIHLDPTRTRWRDPFDEDQEWEPISAPDPCTGRLAALAFHTACVAAREAEALAPYRSRLFDGELSDYQDGIALLRSNLPESPERDAADRDLLEKGMSSDCGVTAVDYVSMGLALETSPALTRVALAHVWDGESETGSGFGLWTEIARHTKGGARAMALALVALAAWRHEDPLAPIAAKEAITVEPDCLIAQAVSAIVGSGALFANFEGAEHLAYLANPQRAFGSAGQDGEVA